MMKQIQFSSITLKSVFTIFIFITLFLNQVNCAPTLGSKSNLDIVNPESIESIGSSNLITHSRTKRSGYSDQRLAELETLLALKRMRDEHLKNRMVAFGLFDPDQIGRRRRRSSGEVDSVLPNTSFGRRQWTHDHSGKQLQL